MRIIGFIRFAGLLVSAGLLTLPSLAGAKPVSSTALVESKLNGGIILNTPSQKLIAAVKDCVGENPRQAGAVVQAVLGGGRADADALAPQVTAAAIEALGSKPSSEAIRDIVYNAVKTTPAVVLEIVRAAVKAAPDYSQAIVVAAVRGVPNPQDKIPPLNDNVSTEDPTLNGLSKSDAKDAKDAAYDENPLPIGEAIAQAAYAANPSVPFQTLLNAANGALTGFSTTSAYPGYYYPVLLGGTPDGGNIPPVVPTPPVVSR